MDCAVLAAETEVVQAVVEDGTNLTRFRLIPAPNTRWSWRGISYVSSSDILVQK